MLVVVLLLVVAAGGVLITSVVTEHPQWAWVSVLLSVLGALVLVLRRSRRRRGTGAAPEASTASTVTSEATAEPASSGSTAVWESGAETTESSAESSDSAGEIGLPVHAGKHAVGANDGGTRLFEVSVRATGAAELAPDEEPGDEGTDARVLLQGSELDVEVVVIDERPRYHLARCPWLGERTTIPLSLGEARELGFTPCALCAPNAVLTQRARANRRRTTRS